MEITFAAATAAWEAYGEGGAAARGSREAGWVWVWVWVWVVGVGVAVGVRVGVGCGCAAGASQLKFFSRWC